MRKVILINNQKGGIGKSNVTFNLGVCLSLIYKKKVLLVDGDGRGDLSDYLGFDYDGNTLCDLFYGYIQDFYVDTEKVKQSIRYNEKHELWYLPIQTNDNGAKLNRELASTTMGDTILSQILCDEVTDDYDFVLIDSSADATCLCFNEFIAADYVVIPVEPEQQAVVGAQMTMKRVMRCNKGKLNTDLRILGMVFTKVQANVREQQAMMGELSDVVGKGDYPFGIEGYPLLFDTRISYSNSAKVCARTRTALCCKGYKKTKASEKLSQQYISLANEIIERTAK